MGPKPHTERVSPPSAAKVRVLELVSQEDVVDWHRGSRSRHIQVNPHDCDLPLLPIPYEELANVAKGQDPGPVRDRFVVLRIAVESVYDLFPTSKLGGCALPNNGAIVLTDH
jgi:hypothetical protein